MLAGMSVPRWERPLYAPGGAAARVLTWVFFERPYSGQLQLSRRRHGVPEGGLRGEIALRVHTEEQDPEWFRGFFEEPGLSLARRKLGSDFAAFERSCCCATVMGSVPDPADLGHIQAGWAVVASLCEHGGVAVLDGHAGRWYTAAEVLGWAPDRGFDVHREISLVFETDATPGIGHIMHTRGMVRFGRPDLVLPGADPELAPLVWELAGALALGLDVGEGSELDLDEAGTVAFLPYTPGQHLPELHLNNQGVVVEIRRR